MSVKICTGTKSRIPEIMTSEIGILDFNDDLKKQASYFCVTSRHHTLFLSRTE